MNPELSPQHPLWAPQIAAQSGAPAAIAALVTGYIMPQPRWPMDTLELAAPDPLASRGTMRMPFRPAGILNRRCARAGISEAGGRAARVRTGLAGGADAIGASALPRGFAFRDAARQRAGRSADADDIPRAESLLALGGVRRAGTGSGGAAGSVAARLPSPTGGSASSDGNHGARGDAGRGSADALAGLRRFPSIRCRWCMERGSIVCGRMGSEGESPRYELSTPALRPRLKLAAGSRYPVSTRDPGVTVRDHRAGGSAAGSKGVAIPERAAIAQSVPSRKPRTFPRPVRPVWFRWCARSRMSPGSAGAPSRQFRICHSLCARSRCVRRPIWNRSTPSRWRISWLRPSRRNSSDQVRTPRSRH